MRQYLLIFVVLIASNLFAQQENPTLFAQCVFVIADEIELLQVETQIKEHPNVQLVRLDHNTQRAFILTKDIEHLTEQELKSWFNTYSESVRCVQIGVYGIDEIDLYPFENCQQ